MKSTPRENQAEKDFDKLDGMKAIAAHLHRSEPTVYKWSTQTYIKGVKFPIPVKKDPGGNVWVSSRKKLDAWWEKVMKAGGTL